MIIETELRAQLMAKGLNRKELNTDPFYQFQSWYQQTLTTDISEPTAMCLANVKSIEPDPSDLTRHCLYCGGNALRLFHHQYEFS